MIDMFKPLEAVNDMWDAVLRRLAAKQDKLQEGEGITISGTTISAPKAMREVYGVEGSSVTMSAASMVAGDVTYRWQYSITGASWGNTSASGYATDTITTTASASKDGYRYRCKITANGTVLYSDVFHLNVL